MRAAGITITMTTMTITGTPEGGLLRLLAWLSPAFPTGAFAYSHGLEWAVEAGDVGDETTLLGWLTDVMTQGSGRTDTILLRHAHRAVAVPSRTMARTGSGTVPRGVPQTVARKGTAMTRPGGVARGDEADLAREETTDLTLTDIANLALATASGRERRGESLDQGKAFMLAAAPWGAPDAPEQIPYPVAVGAVAGAHGVPEDATAVAFVQAVASNLISAAVRLVPLGQTAGLRVLAALEPVIIATAAATKDATLDDIGGCAFRSDLAAMRHETQYTRLFRS